MRKLFSALSDVHWFIKFLQKGDLEVLALEDPIMVKSKLIECRKKSSLEKRIVAIARENSELSDKAIAELVQEKLNRYVRLGTVSALLRRNGIQSSVIRKANEMKEAVLQVRT